MKAISSTFKSGEPSLPDLLADVHNGEVQLPDFQRDWVWDDEHIRSLISSVSLSFPIGAVMLLQTGGEGAHFQPRWIKGAPQDNQSPDYLILDGQQRMTSLYLALLSGKVVPTKTSKGQAVERVYYLDMAKCLNPNEDRFDAVVSLPPERRLTEDFGRKVTLDVSTKDMEYQQGLFPLEIIFDWDRYSAWRREYQSKYRDNQPRYQQFDDFEAQVVGRFKQYRIPTIELLKDTPKEAVCQVFEKVNTGGVTLTVFELVTAIFAASNFNLRDDWNAREARLRVHAVLKEVDATTFLMACTLLATYRRHLSDSDSAVTCKRKDVLKLSLADYRVYADQIEKGLINSARFLAREKVFDTDTLPYSTQLIPLSATCAALDTRFEEDPVKQKLSRWYWSGVFGELYGGANESRFAFDLPELLNWINGGEEPRTLRDATFDPVRLLSLQTRGSAAYKGLMALLMKAGSLDFLSGDSIEITSYFDMNIDIHHIFPANYCEKQDLPRRKWNSIVNKAPLSARTNRSLGGRAPSVYVGTLESQHRIPPSRLDEILRSHQIEPLMLRNNEFDLFIRERAGKLLDLIEGATGKRITGRDSDEVLNEFGAPLQIKLAVESVA